MRPGKLAEHFKRVHPEHAGKSLDYFIRLKENTQKTKRDHLLTCLRCMMIKKNSC